MADLYSRITLATKTAAQPAPLPVELSGLTDASLADLPSSLDPVPAAFTGAGFWPVAVQPVTFNSRTHTTTGQYALNVDAAAKTVKATPTIRALTAEEIAALPKIEDAVVDAERDRRLASGILYNGFRFQTGVLDRDRIDRSRASAMSAIMANAQPGDMQWHGLPVNFFWIAADDTRVPMDAQTMVGFGNAVAAREGMLIVAGSDLKKRIAAGENIPNVGDDSLWPQA